MQQHGWILKSLFEWKEKGSVVFTESQFLGRLIRSLGSPRKREGSGVLKEEKKTNFFFYIPESHKSSFFFKPWSWWLHNKTTQLKPCTKDYITAMYPAWGQFLLHENLLTNPVILKCKLWEWAWWDLFIVSSNPVILKCILWEWVWYDLYNLETFFWFIVNSHWKVCSSLAKTSKRGTLYTLLMSMSEGCSVPFHCNKTSATQEPWVVKPGLWSQS